MRVRNILVTEKDDFLELLIRELIRDGISYVQIENEFHFLDHIYRFFSADEILQVKESDNDKLKYIVFSPIDLVFCKKEEDLVQMFSRADEASICESNTDFSHLAPTKNVPAINKQLIKQQNRRVAQQLKQRKR